jgi:hypothetical protein
MDEGAPEPHPLMAAVGCRDAGPPAPPAEAGSELPAVPPEPSAARLSGAAVAVLEADGWADGGCGGASGGAACEPLGGGEYQMGAQVGEDGGRHRERQAPLPGKHCVHRPSHALSGWCPAAGSAGGPLLRGSVPLPMAGSCEPSPPLLPPAAWLAPTPGTSDAPEPSSLRAGMKGRACGRASFCYGCGCMRARRCAVCDRTRLTRARGRSAAATARAQRARHVPRRRGPTWASCGAPRTAAA